MILRKIDILNFKNIPECSLEFSEGVNCLLGMNGMGKSNLLEAVNFLCMARPMSSMPESALIRHGEDSMLVKGEFRADSDTDQKVACGIVEGKGKSLKLNGKEYPKISDHIGKFPVVAVTPSDSTLVTGGGEERRRLIDMVLSQAGPAYLGALIRYRRALDSRNRMLRSGFRDAILFESVEHTLEESAAYIHQARKEWIAAIRPRLKEIYSEIAGSAEKASVSYRSQLNGKEMKELLDENREKDRVLGYTSVGVHRDDMETTLGDYSMRRLGSQGQVKSFTIALRLAIFEYIRKISGLTPILLLDDIFDKLDSSRVGRIMKMVSCPESFGQIFITDTNREHLDEILRHLDGSPRLFEVSNGTFTLIPTE